MGYTPAAYIELRIDRRPFLKNSSPNFANVMSRLHWSRWSKIADVSELVEWASLAYDDSYKVDVYAELFGIPTPSDAPPRNPPIAGNRGLPQDLSDILRTYVFRGEFSLFEDLTGQESSPGIRHTWATWLELKPFLSKEITRDWRAVINMVGSLAEIYGDDNVRIVAWMEK